MWFVGRERGWWGRIEAMFDKEGRIEGKVVHRV